ncbi:MAG: LysE family transporter [Pseudomonadota bacterium]|nr:LysE family transporter [Pseudomonadota bacterium]
MSLELWLVYCVAAVGLSLTPGPNGLLSLTHGACFGFRPTVYTVLGGALGFFILIAASLGGMGALLAASERAFTIAKWIGAAYLVYLGLRIWRAPPPVVALTADRGAAGEARPLRLFNQGFLVAVSNPKALIFFAAFLPQFMAPGVPYAIQLAVFGGTFVVVEIAYELLLALMAQRIAPWLARHGRWFNRAAGATFVGIGAALTTASR